MVEYEISKSTIVGSSFRPFSLSARWYKRCGSCQVTSDTVSSEKKAKPILTAHQKALGMAVSWDREASVMRVFKR
jgi:hypothetical protein